MLADAAGPRDSNYTRVSNTTSDSKPPGKNIAPQERVLTGLNVE